MGRRLQQDFGFYDCGILFEDQHLFVRDGSHITKWYKCISADMMADLVRRSLNKVWLGKDRVTSSVYEWLDAELLGVFTSTTQCSTDGKGWQVLPFPSMENGLAWGVLNKSHQELSPCMTFSWQSLWGRESPCFNYMILILQFQHNGFSDRCATTLI